MAPVNSASSMEISDIQRRMAQIRHEMHQDVQGVVIGAQSLTDWRSLVRGHPWLALGLAVTAGFLIVPKRRREPVTVVSAGASPAQIAAILPGVQTVPASRSKVITMGTVLGLLAPVAVRAAQNYALKQFEEWLERHPLTPPGMSQSRSYDSGPTPVAARSAPARFRDSR